MKRSFRLKSPLDFKRVRLHGKSFAHPLVVMLALRSQNPQTRIGVSAGRSIGNAVRRNRAKRRLRAAIHPYLEQLTPGWDLVFLARKPLLDAPFAEIQQAIERLLQRAGLIENERTNV